MGQPGSCLETPGPFNLGHLNRYQSRLFTLVLSTSTSTQFLLLPTQITLLTMADLSSLTKLSKTATQTPNTLSPGQTALHRCLLPWRQWLSPILTLIGLSTLTNIVTRSLYTLCHLMFIISQKIRTTITIIIVTIIIIFNKQSTYTKNKLSKFPGAMPVIRVRTRIQAHVCLTHNHDIYILLSETSHNTGSLHILAHAFLLLGPFLLKREDAV